MIARVKNMKNEYTTILDNESRTTLPMQLREQLGDSFTIAKNLRTNSLRVYTEDNWNKFANELFRNNPRNKVEQLLRFMSAVIVELHSKGRFFLPAHLRGYAQMEKNIVFTTEESDYIVMWSKENYIQHRPRT
jgi:division/cell wall cluster transcriptional repressor MraZ